MSSQQPYKSAFNAVLEWCRNCKGAAMVRLSSEQNIPGAVECAADFEMPALPRCFFDASLLFRCMDVFQVDRSELARGDPLLFRELQGVCSLCRSKAECSQDLVYEFNDARLDKLRAYCPNAAMLIMIGALQNRDAAQQLTLVHS